MNWNQLQYVITIAEEKSITKAAQKLYISQPSLSLSIQALEKETGIPLFERNRGEMKLTYAGSLFYEWAISTLHSHTQLEWKLGDIVSGSRTLIRLGLSPHRSERLLAPVLERFYSMYENCDIQIIEQPTYILRQMLEEDKLDLILDISSPDTINYESELLVKESFVLAIPDSLCPFPIHHKKRRTSLPLLKFICLRYLQFHLFCFLKITISERSAGRSAKLLPSIRISAASAPAVILPFLLQDEEWGLPFFLKFMHGLLPFRTFISLPRITFMTPGTSVLSTGKIFIIMHSFRRFLLSSARSSRQSTGQLSLP